MHIPNEVVDTTCRTLAGAETTPAHALKLNTAASGPANQNRV